MFCVCGDLKEYAKNDALDMFLEKYARYAAGEQNLPYVLNNGGLNTQNNISGDDIEDKLDVQYAASLRFKDNTKYCSTRGLGIVVPDLDQPDSSIGQNEPYPDFLK